MSRSLKSAMLRGAAVAAIAAAAAVLATGASAAETTASGSYSPCSAYWYINFTLSTGPMWATGSIYSCGSMTLCLQSSTNGTNWSAPFGCTTGAGAYISTNQYDPLCGIYHYHRGLSIILGTTRYTNTTIVC
jgi:hypothetical protein